MQELGRTATVTCVMTVGRGPHLHSHLSAVVWSVLCCLLLHFLWVRQNAIEKMPPGAVSRCWRLSHGVMSTPPPRAPCDSYGKVPN